MFTNVDYVLLKTKTRIRPVHAHHLCRALFFQSFHRPLLNGTKPEQKGIAFAKGTEGFFEVSLLSAL